MSIYTLLSASSGALITDPTWIFFLVLVIILLSPLLLSRLHIPHVIGLILSGILVGQYGFNLLERDSSFEIFGQVGIYYIMFLAGLELDMGSVAKYGARGLQFGVLTFGIPLTMGFVAARYLLGYGILPSLLVSCILSSHTLVSFPIVTRYGVGRHKTVVVSIVATAFALFAALLLLALVVGMRDPGTTWVTWCLFLLKFIVYVAIVAGVFPRIGRWFLRRYDDSVVQFIFVLALVFLSAALANMVGLEGLLGAFLAGLAINRLIPQNGPLINRIEFMGNAIFIPYFLIGVGMMIDVRMMFGGTAALWTVAVMVGVATLSKWLAAKLMSVMFFHSRDAMWLMFGLTNAHAAGALAIVMVGTDPDVGLMDPLVLNGTIMVILFSCIVSSLATSRGARRLALSDTTLEENRGSYHGKCLVTYSQDSHVDVMTQIAILIRNPYIPDSLMGLTVAYDDEQGEDQHRRGRKLLENAQKVAASAGISMATLNRMSTNIASAILHTMKEYEAGEVIMCLNDRDTDMVRSSLTGVIDNVLSGSHREVIAVRAIVPPGTLRKIVVVVPQKAEYEVGFYKWLEHLCRMGEQIGCRMEFHSHPDTAPYIQGYMGSKHPNVRASFVALTQWKTLRPLAASMNEDQMLVVVTARPGFISYTRQLDAVPQLLHRHFSRTSVVLLYPDQWGDPLDTVSIFAPNGRAITRKPRTLDDWMRRGWMRLTGQDFA